MTPEERKQLKADPETLLAELAWITQQCVTGYQAERPSTDGPMAYTAVELGTAVQAVKLRYQIGQDQVEGLNRSKDAVLVRPMVVYGADA